MFTRILTPADASPPRPSAREWTILAVLTLLVAVVHSIGLDWHLPHHAHTDEMVLHLQLQSERGVALDEAHRELARCYPSLLGKIANLVVAPVASEAPQDVVALRAAAAHDLLGIRALVAILSSLVVPATWFAARWIVAGRWAFLAAGLAGASTIAVWYSSMARPHAVVAVFTTAAVAMSLRARFHGRFVDFAVAGAFAAAAVGTLHSGACACAAVAAGWWWCAKPRWGRPLAGAAFGAVLVFAGIFVFLRGEGLRDLQSQAEPADALLSFFGMGAHNVDTSYFDGRGFARFARAMLDYEPVLALLAVTGVVALVVAHVRTGSRSPSTAVVCTWLAQPVVHFVLFGLYGDSFQRFWFPLIPHLAIFATVGVAALVMRPAGGVRPIGAVVAGALLFLQPAVAAKLAILRARDDTHELAAQWVVDHPERGPFHVGPTVYLPLVPRDPGFRHDLLGSRLTFIPWIAMLDRIEPAVNERVGVELRDLPLRKREARVLLEAEPARFVDGLGSGVVLVEHVHHELRRVFSVLREELAKRGPPVATFEPRALGVPGTLPIDYLLDGPHAPERGFAWSALWASRLGPEIEVFAVER